MMVRFLDLKKSRKEMNSGEAFSYPFALDF